MNSKKIILFVPIMCYPWPQRPVEKGQPFPMEYVKWHKSLIKYFSTKRDCKFIWKNVLLINQENDFDLAQLIIKDKGYDNIEYHTNKLSDWFKKIDKIIFDTPSTAFFEAIYSNIPSLALYRPEEQRLRMNAYEEFDDCLKGYSSVKEGLAIVDNFIDDDSNKYKVELKKSKSSIHEILLKNKIA